MKNPLGYLAAAFLAATGLAMGQPSVAAAAEAADDGGAVALPPYFVTEDRGGQPWHYGAVPGFEFLSHCSDAVTRTFAQAFCAQHRLFHEIVPAELEYQTSVPTALIIFDRQMERAMAREMVAVMENAGKTSFQGIPQMRLWDADSTGIDFVLDNGKRDDYRDFYLSPDYIRYLLAKRTPALPAWFVEGVADLYRGSTFSEDSIELNFARWTSPETTKAIQDNPAFPRTLLPMAEFLGGAAPAEGATDAERERFRIWRAQAALLVRWAVDGRDHPRRHAFWKFIARASAGPITEDVFREYFGAGFAAFDTQLNAYLADAVRTSVILTAAEPDTAADLDLRPATRAEIGRLEGDWERKEIALVRKTHPEYAQKYVDQARAILSAAHADSPRDPGLQAVFGLFECQNGNPSQGRALLESAVAAHAIRPSAYVELARLRLADGLAHPAGTAGQLSAGQAAAVTDLLGAARSQLPPQPESQALFDQALQRSAAALSPP